MTLITDNGIHIIENVRTDLIADAAAKSGRATFFLSMTVPKAVGLTGTFVNIEDTVCVAAGASAPVFSRCSARLRPRPDKKHEGRGATLSYCSCQSR